MCNAREARISDSDGEEHDGAQVARGASTKSAVELLDRFYAALPEAMGNTMCAEGDSLAAAARVGRARGLLGLFAQATAGVYQQPAVNSSKENQNGSANATGSGAGAPAPFLYRSVKCLQGDVVISPCG